MCNIVEDATEVIEDGSYHHVATKENEQESVARHLDWEQSDQEGVGRDGWHSVDVRLQCHHTLRDHGEHEYG